MFKYIHKLIFYLKYYTGPIWPFRRTIIVPLSLWDDIIYINRVLDNKKLLKYKIATNIGNEIRSVVQQPYKKESEHTAVQIFNALCESDVIQVNSETTKRDVLRFSDKYKISIKKVVL